MDVIDKIKGLLKEVGESINTQRSQFGSKSVTKGEKDKIIEMSVKIDTCRTLCETRVVGLKLVIEHRNTDIERIVQASLQSVQTSTPRPTYSSVATRSVAIPNKNKIIIKSENIEKFDKELRQKISPTKEKVNVTFYKKINNNTAIINTASKEESERLTKAITEKITEVKVQQEKLLDPSIVIFRTNNILKEDVTEFFKESFGLDPVSVHKITGPKASRMYVHCSPELYQKLPAEKRLQIKWESLSFVDCINPRLCKKCCRFGHGEKFYKASEEYIKFINTNKEISCTNCLYARVAKACAYKDVDKKLNDKEVVGKCLQSIEHTTLNKNCPCYLKAVENLRSKTNFGS